MRVPARFDRRALLLWVLAIATAAALAVWDYADEPPPGAGDPGATEPAAAEPGAAGPDRPARQDVEIVGGEPPADGGRPDSGAIAAPDRAPPRPGGGRP